MRFLVAGLLVFVWAITHRERGPSPPVALGFSAGVSDLCRRLRPALLGGAARSVGYRRGDSGYHSWFHGAVGDPASAHAAAHSPGSRSACGLCRRGSARKPVALAWQSRRRAIDNAGAIALVIGAMSWSIASALSRKLPLPSSKVMSSGAQMLAGGIMLAAVAALAARSWVSSVAVSGSAWIALLYLIFAGSIAGFTAYVWLLHDESPTKVGTYAYVNPVVAVVLGYFLGGEPLGLALWSAECLCWRASS